MTADDIDFSGDRAGVVHPVRLRDRIAALRVAAGLGPVLRLRPCQRAPGASRRWRRRRPAGSRPAGARLVGDARPGAHARRSRSPARRAPRAPRATAGSSQPGAACSPPRIASPPSRPRPRSPRRSARARSRPGRSRTRRCAAPSIRRAVPQTRAERDAVTRRHARRVHRDAAPARHRRRRPAQRGAPHASTCTTIPTCAAASRGRSAAAASRRRSSRACAARRRAGTNAIPAGSSSWSRPPTAPSWRCAPTGARCRAGRCTPIRCRCTRARTPSRAARCRRRSTSRSAAAPPPPTSTATAAPRSWPARSPASSTCGTRTGTPARRLPRPHRAALLGTQRARPLQPPAARASSPRPCSPTSTVTTALEIIAAAMDRHVYVWRADGSPQPGWPVLVVDRTQMASIDPVSHHVVPKTVGRPVGGAPGHEDRVDARRRRAARRRQAGRGRRQQRGVPRAVELLVGRQRVDRHVPGARAARPCQRPAARHPGGRQRRPGGRGQPRRARSCRAGRCGSACSPPSCCRGSRACPGSPVLADVDGDGRLEVGIASRGRAGLHPARGRHVLLRHRTRRPAADAADGPRVLRRRHHDDRRPVGPGARQRQLRADRRRTGRSST